MTFEELIADLLATCDDRHDDVEPFLRKAVVRALGPPLSRLRAEWTEKTTTFTTEADATEYDSSVGVGFPADVGDVDLVSFDAATHGHSRQLVARPFAEVRSLAAQGTGEPRIYAWRHRNLVVGPPTAADYTLRLDYTIDARRDETSGALITKDDTTTTNAWFRLGEGQDVLRSRVLTDYYGSFSRNERLAAVFSSFFESARREMRSALTNRRDDGVVAPAMWTGDDLWPHGYSDRWRGGR